MKRKVIFCTLLIFAICTIPVLAIQRTAITRADDNAEIVQFLPMVRSTFAAGISPYVSDIVPPSVVTGIVDPGDGRLFIATRDGRIQVSSQDGTLQPDLLLDIRDKVLDDGNESGLVGLAAHPDFAANGHIYTFYVEEIGGGYYAVLARYTVNADGYADVATEQRILHFELPTLRHHGGALQFGPKDGYLYVSVGDGGTLGDSDGNAQSTATLLGKILRIDINNGSPYAVPADNPFASDPESRGEIWALGLRNPWRFSFDRETGDMYIGDVGQYNWEEIDFIPAASGGENFGWPCWEGPLRFDKEACDDNAVYEEPVHFYTLDPQPCAAVVGGYVYRGTQLPELNGHYLFVDLCDGVIWSLIQVEDHVWKARDWGYFGQQYTTFGERSDGELLLGASNRTIYQLIRPGASD